ncbi:hypothetical protein PISMIDRAFT_571835 [Pisolithus microcarpus 441]|uniref:Uncharacterized protein n=1 Tax=Pisolithus microcarpus 441 TaxID=765257 RepID=A0A0C9YVV6_9AGAM|nr:hypothetical protein PISMIDRAFT_571835 [Pisolithus microcarpus 441]
MTIEWQRDGGVKGMALQYHTIQVPPREAMRTGITTHNEPFQVPMEIRQQAWSAVYSRFSCAARGEEERLMLAQHGRNGRMVYVGTC